MGDLVIICTGGTPTAAGAAVPAVNISITLGNIAITSRLMNTATPPLTDALVVLDEALTGPTVPPVAGQFGCSAPICINAGSGTGAPLYGSATQGTGAVGSPFVTGANRNIFQGVLETPNRLTFFGIPIDPPGTNTRTIRITNVRGNASQAGIGNVAVQIFETVSVSIPSLLPLSGLSTQAVASVQRGLFFEVRSGTGGTFSTQGLQQCVSLASTAAAVATLRYTEGFATAFLKRNVATSSATPLANAEQNALGNTPPAPFSTETMYTTGNTTLQANTTGGACPPGSSCAIGQADFGTRIKAVFLNVPSGASIFVERTSTSANGETAVATATENGIFSAVAAATATGTPGPAGGVVSLTPVNGLATAVWEVLDSVPGSVAIFNFRVWITFTSNPGTNTPALGTATVNGSFAPTPPIPFTAAQGAAASNTLPIPRFVDTSVVSNLFTIAPCQTTLLFPYVTTQAGFDTGLAISATSADPFGTALQSGTCTLNWFGTAFTGVTATPSVTAGTTWVGLGSSILSTVTGGFTGYMIAVCRFQYAHGFAFISDLGARNLAMGYLALVIPDVIGSSGTGRGNGASPFSGAAPNTGEQLGY